jgi:SAM-dependent methyltransferase
MSVQAFYDDLAPLYHLVYENWEATVARQGTALASLIGEEWGAGARSVLDAAIGIGTQALGLLALGFRVTGSDLSPVSVIRAQREAAARHLPLACVVADFRALPIRTASVDVVIVCDNALPHLETPREIEITPADGADADATILKTSYLAIPVEQVGGLMRAVGFENVRRVDGRFFHPVLVGTRPLV